MTQLPIFVYGTLRHGQSNYQPYLAGQTAREHPAILPDHALHIGAYPYVFDTDDGSHVYGELVFPLPHLYDDVLARLDELENYREGDPSSMYLRVQRPVRYTGANGEPQTITAWVYHAGPDYTREATEQNRIPSGDWLTHQEGQ
jgi:gamma-glutamylcyclotransferase (GGCT)/AIG2-like uncharacterized protein YtfP